MAQYGFWFSDASLPTAEIVAGLGYDFVVLDLEHGMFSLESLGWFIPSVRNLGLTVFTKVLDPTAAAIQQPLDFGANGVIVPHVRSAAHAEELSSYARYPTRGKRSMAGGHLFGWGAWTNERIMELDAETMFFPLIEDPGAVAEIEQIAALDNVDGFQMGPGDLSLTSGRGAFAQTDADWTDIHRCVSAFESNSKPWMYPAWTTAEQAWAAKNGATMMIIGHQYGAIAAGAANALSGARAL